MQRTFIGGGLLILTCCLAVAQDGRDPRLDDLRVEIAQLGRIVADQDKRLEDPRKASPHSFAAPLRIKSEGSPNWKRRCGRCRLRWLRRPTVFLLRLRPGISL